MKIYTFNDNYIYSGARVISESEKMPKNATAIQPPADQPRGDYIYIFNGVAWESVKKQDVQYVHTSHTPDVVTMRQARLALLDLDLLSSIDEAINAMPEPDKTKAKIEWEYAAMVERNSDWVSDLGQQLGLSDVQIDDLFRLAATK